MPQTWASTGLDGIYLSGPLFPGTYRITWTCDEGHAWQTEPPTVADIATVTLAEGEIYRRDLDYALVEDGSTVRNRPCTIRSDAPRLRGRATVGARVTAVAGNATPRAARPRFTWFVDGRRLRATSPTLTLRRAHRGHRLSVRVTWELDGFPRVSRASRPVRVR